MPVLIRDYETRSTVSLRACGAWMYSRHPTTEVLCCAYAVDDSEIQLWTSTEPVPQPFIEAANDPDWLICAFNDQFERWIEQHIMGPRYGWPEVPIERHRCLQAAGLAMALPASLEAMAAALKLNIRKDLVGRRNMLLMSRPRKARADEDPQAVHWHDNPERRAALHEYCRQDVATERALYRRIGFLSPEEQAHWVIDAAINARGVPIDRGLLDAAIKITEAAKREIAAEIASITQGAVTGINQTARITAWLTANGCVVSDLQKPTLQKALISSALPKIARRLIELRLSGAIAAASKLQDHAQLDGPRRSDPWRLPLSRREHGTIYEPRRSTAEHEARRHERHGGCDRGGYDRRSRSFAQALRPTDRGDRGYHPRPRSRLRRDADS